MNFGDALHNMKAGLRMARQGWNGSGMYVTFERAVAPLTRGYLALKTADGSVVPWAISQTDALADDWIALP